MKAGTIYFILFAFLISCSDAPQEEKKLPPAVVAVKRTDFSKLKPWFGHYSHFKDGVVVNDVSVGMVEYTVDLNDTLCLFKGSGYQVYFEYLCQPQISGDTLFLHEERDVSYGNNKPAEKEYGTILIRKKNSYILRSRKLADEKMRMKRSTEKVK